MNEKDHRVEKMVHYANGPSFRRDQQYSKVPKMLVSVVPCCLQRTGSFGAVGYMDPVTGLLLLPVVLNISMSC